MTPLKRDLTLLNFGYYFSWPKSHYLLWHYWQYNLDIKNSKDPEFDISEDGQDCFQSASLCYSVYHCIFQTFGGVIYTLWYVCAPLFVFYQLFSLIADINYWNSLKGLSIPSFNDGLIMWSGMQAGWMTYPLKVKVTKRRASPGSFGPVRGRGGEMGDRWSAST